MSFQSDPIPEHPVAPGLYAQEKGSFEVSGETPSHGQSITSETSLLRTPMHTPAEIAKIDEVRTRLGMEPSRRGFLGGILAGATVAAVPEVAFAQKSQEGEFTKEQQEEYEAGIQEMRNSAATDTEEISRFYVVERDGTSRWEKPAMESTFATGVIIGVVDGDAEGKIMARLSEGARVTDFHTHPTKGILKLANEVAPRPGYTDQVPPSQLDVLDLLTKNMHLDEAERARYRTQVVTEAGIWEYGFMSKSDITNLDSLFGVALAPFNELDTLKKEGQELARYLTNATTHLEGLSKVVTENLIEYLDKGSLGAFLADNPLLIDEVTNQIETVLPGDTKLPPNAARYISRMKRGVALFDAALQKISPSAVGHLADGPMPGMVDAYVARWKSLGVDMKFTPFKDELKQQSTPKVREHESVK